MMANHIDDVLDAMDIRFPSWFVPVCIKEYVLACKWLHLDCIKMWIPGSDYCPVITPIPFFPLWDYFRKEFVYPDPERMPAEMRRAFEKMMAEISKKRTR
jgi:hypothetical protein